jgi:hypothetical protein
MLLYYTYIVKFSIFRSLLELWKGTCLVIQPQYTVVGPVPATPITLLVARVLELLLPFIPLPEYEGCATAT